MNEKLIAGYAAYTDAEELSGDALNSVPATIEIVTATVASFVASAKTYDIAC
ncbi:LxmA leader domain family RiPP [Streptomyces sp. bgisy091]|uniref:LxmA leader domain family RiPP n=1 Tax=Streptomyces sp. bgisy091 TaxID=3413778 RepID=UPI003D71AA6F